MSTGLVEAAVAMREGRYASGVGGDRCGDSGLAGRVWRPSAATPGRLQARLAASAAGLQELAILREKQRNLVEQAKMLIYHRCDGLGEEKAGHVYNDTETNTPQPSMISISIDDNTQCSTHEMPTTSVTETHQYIRRHSVDSSLSPSCVPSWVNPHNFARPGHRENEQHEHELYYVTKQCNDRFKCSECSPGRYSSSKSLCDHIPEDSGEFSTACSRPRSRSLNFISNNSLSMQGGCDIGIDDYPKQDKSLQPQSSCSSSGKDLDSASQHAQSTIHSFQTTYGIVKSDCHGGDFARVRGSRFNSLPLSVSRVKELETNSRPRSSSLCLIPPSSPSCQLTQQNGSRSPSLLPNKTLDNVHLQYALRPRSSSYATTERGPVKPCSFSEAIQSNQLRPTQSLHVDLDKAHRHENINRMNNKVGMLPVSADVHDDSFHRPRTLSSTQTTYHFPSPMHAILLQYNKLVDDPTQEHSNVQVKSESPHEGHGQRETCVSRSRSFSIQPKTGHHTSPIDTLKSTAYQLRHAASMDNINIGVKAHMHASGGDGNISRGDLILDLLRDMKVSSSKKGIIPNTPDKLSTSAIEMPLITHDNTPCRSPNSVSSTPEEGYFSYPGSPQTSTPRSDRHVDNLNANRCSRLTEQDMCKRRSKLYTFGTPSGKNKANKIRNTLEDSCLSDSACSEDSSSDCWETFV